MGSDDQPAEAVRPDFSPASSAQAQLDTLTALTADYKRLAEHTTDVIVYADLSGVLRWVSPSCRDWGFEPDELIGTTGAQLVHPDDLARFSANFANLFSGGPIDRTVIREHRFRVRSGQWIWLEGNPRVIYDAAGAPAGMVNVFRDVTERRALQDHSARQAQWRDLAEEISGVGYWRMDVASGEIEWSKQMYLVYGMEPDVAPDLARAMAMVHPEDREAANGRVDRALRLGEGWTDGLTRLVTPTGELRYVDGRGLCERNAAGAIVALFGTMIDITRHKLAEEKVTESETLYRLLAENVTDMIVTTDLSGRLLYASPSCEAVMGYTAAELGGTRAIERTHPDDIAGVVRRFASLLSGEPPETLRWRGKHKATKTWMWLESKPSLMRDPVTGAPTGFLDVIRDVTEQHLTETLIAESETRYRLVAENATDMIVTSSLDGRTVYLSPSAEKLTGYPLDEIIGARTLDFVHPDDGVLMIRAFRTLLNGEPPARLRWRGKHKSGHWIWFESMPALAIDPKSGQANGFVDVVRDVTLQVQQEEALREARAIAESATAVKTEFLANMSHELRTPLTSILGFAELLKGHVPPGGEGQRYLERVAGASEALMSIVNDILDFSKLEAGQVAIDLRPTQPAALFEGVVQLLSPQARDKDLLLGFTADPAVPAAALLDDVRVRQVLLNLTGNAVKFTAVGEIHVTLSAPDAGTLRCAVADTGPGVPPERLDRLFQRFSQVDASTTRAHGGTGLGLAICKGLVEAMGGRIGVDSVVGQGSTFWFELPCQSIERDLAIDLPAHPGGEADEADYSALAGLRVLVADDNPMNRELVRLYLSMVEIEVTDVDCGEAAVEAAMAAPFDLILMDIRMPGEGGPAAARAIRQGRGPNDITPIVAFTADADNGETPASWGDAFNDRVGKPIVAAQLFSILARWTAEPLDTADAEIQSMETIRV